MHWSKWAVYVSILVLIACPFALKNPASAVTLETVLNPDANNAVLRYSELHTVVINYPEGSKLSQLFNSAIQRIPINASTSDSRIKANQNAMETLVANINKALASRNTLVRASGANMTIITDVKRLSSTSSIVAQRLNLDIDVDGYIIPNKDDPAHKYLDFNWRAFTVNDPVTLQYDDNGKTRSIEVNMMSDALEAAMPGFGNTFRAAGAGENEIAFLQRPVIDFSKLSPSMDKWYVLFDPTASIVETERFKYVGEINGAKVDTIYSFGEGSIREGPHTDEVITSSFSSGDDRYSMEFTIPAPNGRIDVLGYSKMTSVNGDDTAIISDKNEGGSSYAGNFPFVVLGSLGAIMGVIVVFVFVKSRNKKSDALR